MDLLTSAVLVPVDGSDLSVPAVHQGAALAELAGVPLHLLSVVDSAERLALGDFARSEGVSTDDAAERRLRQCSGDLPDAVDVHHFVIVDDHPAEAILRHVEHHPVSMIVMASHGRSGMTRWLLGSVADKIVRTSPVPVTIVPAGARAAGTGAA